MPRGSRGQWRPADPVAAGVHIGKLATHEIEETFEPPARLDPRSTTAGARARPLELAPSR